MNEISTNMNEISTNMNEISTNMNEISTLSVLVLFYYMAYNMLHVTGA